MAEKEEHDQLEPEGNKKDSDDGEPNETADRTLMCGWGRWRPNWLQPLSRPSVFLIFVFIFALTAGISSGLTSVNLPEIEKEFGLSSKQSAVILLSNDIGGIVLLPFVSFYGTHGKKPKWIGLGAIICASGALLMTLPKVMIGRYEIPGTSGGAGRGSNTCVGQQFPFEKASCDNNEGYASAVKYLFIFCTAQFIFGIGSTPVWPLAPAYLDENVNPKNAPIYVGVWFVSNFLGRGLGYLVGGAFLRVFTDLTVPAGFALSKRDTRWIGAWWLGFFVFAWVMLISGAALLCFPREMPEYRKKRVIAMKKGKLPTENKDIGKGFKDLLKALVDLLKNKTYVFSSLALTIKITFAAALGGFYTKVLVLKFGGTFSEVALYSAAVFIPGNTLGVGLGSLVMKKLSVKDSAKKATVILIICGVVATAFSTVWLLPGCKTTNIAGGAMPYKDSTDTGSLISKCNIQCTCSQRAYEPICGNDGITYFSPCFAGCQFKNTNNKQSSGNCSCIENSNSKINVANLTTNGSSSSIYGTAVNGRCNRGCKNLFVFLACSAIILMVNFLGSIPQKMLTLRCVPDNQRAFGLGIQVLFLRSLSFIPGPLILGTIIDSNCLVWSIDECGNRGNCLEYNVNQLSKHFLVFAIVAASVATFFYFLAWFFYVPMATAEVVKDQNENVGKQGLLLEKNNSKNEETV